MRRFFVLLLVLTQSAIVQGSQAKLSESSARLRALQVSQVRYELELQLSENDLHFAGNINITFVLNPQKQPVRIDFARGFIKKVKINGQERSYAYDGESIQIPETSFKAGQSNEIHIAFQHRYSRDGVGLYRFQDPLDHEVYIYSDFETYFANQMFPCFDQPDLKAIFKLRAKAPKSWQLVSTTREQSIRKSGSMRIWDFAPTAPIATYVFSLHGGPFKIWEDSSFRIPLRIMSRRSLASYVNAEQWLEWTRFGLDYFDKTFAYPFPFQKYDQIVVPDFSSGAMENVAAVTFAESFFPNGHRSKADIQEHAETVWHEMAHMWFGNLVTMRWWNDLWLNESFATYAAAMAMAQHPDFPDVWLHFHASKSWAGYADQLVTTHPTATLVPDTDVANSNFDGITYGKGGAFLQLLSTRLGEAPFVKGLQLYFARYAFRNTEFKDLIGTLEEASGQKLTEFAKTWLETAGQNTLQAEFSCRAGKIDHFALKQGSALPEYPMTREHWTSIGLYKKNADGKLQSLHSSLIPYHGEATAWKEFEGLDCPDLVFPNQSDVDYVKVILDPLSLKFVRESLHLVQDPLQRLLLWDILGSMVEDAILPMDDFLDIFAQQFPLEQNYQSLLAMTDTLRQRILRYLDLFPQSEGQKHYVNRIIKILDEKLEEANFTEDTHRLCYNLLVSVLALAQESDRLAKLFQYPTADHPLDQDQRWDIIQALSIVGHPKAMSWLELERKRDPSSDGEQAYLMAKASWPDLESKRKLLAPIIEGQSKLSAADRKTIIASLFPSSQKDLHRLYQDQYIKDLELLPTELEATVQESFVATLLPIFCDEGGDELAVKLIQRPWPEALKRALLIQRQTQQRCLRMVNLRKS